MTHSDGSRRLNAMKVHLALLILMAVLVASCGRDLPVWPPVDVEPATEEMWPPVTEVRRVKNGLIAFGSTRGIEVIDPDGGERRTIVEGSELTSRGLDWSPDGRWLAFGGVVDGQGGLFLVKPEGGESRRVTPPGLDVWSPDWSPDGSRLAFSATVKDVGVIFTIGADGDDLQRVTAPDEHSAGAPAWSPDGQRIAFVSEDPNLSERVGEENVGVSEPENIEIFVTTLDGSRVQQLTDHPELDHDPDWSPDGRSIVFRSRRSDVERAGRGDEIYVMTADSGLRRLTHDASTDQGAVWSPDGTRLAFDSSREGTTGIYIMRADGSGIRLVALGGYSPAWQSVPA